MCAMNKEKYNNIKKILETLNERQKRMYLASEAEAIGRGGIKEISELFGIHRNTLTAGKKDLHSDDILNDTENSKRVRRPGGGRKSILSKYPNLEKIVEKLIENDSFGNPENPLRWTTKSLRNIANELKELGYTIGYVTVGKILTKLGYSLQINRKMLQVGKDSPDRNEQFHHINDTAKSYIEENNPVISVDCKKKENIGNFSNNGAEYAPKKTPIQVFDHDFLDSEKGKAVPYGIYDIMNNEGYVNIGISKDTASFAVHSIHTWWEEMGKARYPNATKLYITADGGGSNGSRCKLWKSELQSFANKTGLTVEVSHFPPGTSKWNKIEHRLFSQISKNWRGKPLISLAVVVNLISSTKTNTGLKVKCGIDRTEYVTGIKVDKSVMDALNIIKNDFHGEWNYTISPNSSQSLSA